MLIVGTTSRLEIACGRFAAGSERHDMMVFEEARFSAASSRALERASPAISLPHGSPDGRWDIA